jgi:hypothetical protein
MSSKRSAEQTQLDAERVPLLSSAGADVHQAGAGAGRVPAGANPAALEFPLAGPGADALRALHAMRRRQPPRGGGRLTPPRGALCGGAA